MWDLVMSAHGYTIWGRKNSQGSYCEFRAQGRGKIGYFATHNAAYSAIIRWTKEEYNGAW